MKKENIKVHFKIDVKKLDAFNLTFCTHGYWAKLSPDGKAVEIWKAKGF